MIKNLEKFRQTIERGLLDGMTIEHLYSLCVQFGSIDGKASGGDFLRAISAEVFQDGNRDVGRRAVEVMFCLGDGSGVTMSVHPKPSEVSEMTLLLSEVGHNAMMARKRNALVGLNLLQEAISKEAIGRDQIAILDAGEAAAETGYDTDLIMSGLKAWRVLFSACADGILNLKVFTIEELSPRYFNDV